MKKKLVKFLEFVAVIVSLIISFFVVKSIGVESILRGKEEQVTLAMTEDGFPEDHIGMPAGDDIPRITDAATWEDTWQTSFVTIESSNVIPTGIGSRHPWISAYSNTRRGGQRHRPDVSNMAFDVLDEYAEYFLLQIPDGSYILAQMPSDVARKLKAGKEVTMPIGRKSSVHQQALTNIADLCSEYNVNTDGVFYCFNDEWNESHYLIVQLIRIGGCLLMTLVIGSILITIIGKAFKVKD
ncbi:MAG: hypothetical protein K2P65_02825 [Lachnospiraceae bacterium]|nr:hypothetical protein [Lachnospiraceae bacterium]